MIMMLRWMLRRMLMIMMMMTMVMITTMVVTVWCGDGVVILVALKWPTSRLTTSACTTSDTAVTVAAAGGCER